MTSEAIDITCIICGVMHRVQQYETEEIRLKTYDLRSKETVALAQIRH